MASPGASTVEDAAKLSNDGTASSSIDVVRLLADHAIDQISKLAPEMPTQDSEKATKILYLEQAISTINPKLNATGRNAVKKSINNIVWGDDKTRHKMSTLKYQIYFPPIGARNGAKATLLPSLIQCETLRCLNLGKTNQNIISYYNKRGWNFMTCCDPELRGTGAKNKEREEKQTPEQLEHEGKKNRELEKSTSPISASNCALGKSPSPTLGEPPKKRRRPDELAVDTERGSDEKNLDTLPLLPDSVEVRSGTPGNEANSAIQIHDRPAAVVYGPAHRQPQSVENNDDYSVQHSETSGSITSKSENMESSYQHTPDVYAPTANAHPLVDDANTATNFSFDFDSIDDAIDGPPELADLAEEIIMLDIEINVQKVKRDCLMQRYKALRSQCGPAGTRSQHD